MPEPSPHVPNPRARGSAIESSDPMDYEYDVFISYRRSELLEEWLGEDEFFVYLLKSYLKLELRREPRIFRDEPAINAGDRWRLKIERALRCSRCLVPIGTADYFDSSWCTAEFEAFADRVAMTGGAELIVPLAWHDWDPVPPPVGEVQVANFRPLAFIGMRDDPGGKVRFQKSVRDFAATLAKKILAAPPFDPRWTALLPSVDEVMAPSIELPSDME